MSTEPLHRRLYSPRDAGHILGLSHATIYRLIAAHKLQAVKIAGATRITGESIEDFLASLPPARIRAA